MRRTLISVLCALSPLNVLAVSTDYMVDYYSGDYYKASKSLQVLANNNDKQALFYLGKIYVNGYTGSKNQKKGLNFIQESGRLGYEPAQLYMAKYFLNVKNGIPQALDWYKRAAEQGNVSAQVFCGLAYVNGYGTRKSDEQARYWFEKAVQSNDTIAQYELALLNLKSGDHAKTDDALKYLEKSGNKMTYMRKKLLNF